MKKNHSQLYIILTLFCFSMLNNLYSQQPNDLPTNAKYHKKYDEIYLGGGSDMKDINNTYYSIGIIQSYKMTNLVYFTMDNNFIGTFSGSEKKYVTLSVSPGFTFMHYFGNSFRIYETTTIGISYIFKGDTPDFINLGYCGGIRIGFGYDRFCLDAGVKHFEHKGASYTPITLGLRLDIYKLF